MVDGSKTFLDEFKGSLERIRKDVQIDFPLLKEFLVSHQRPETYCKLTKLRGHVDEVKEIILQTSEAILERGLALDSLVVKSSDLSAQSKLFLCFFEETEFLFHDSVNKKILIPYFFKIHTESSHT